MYIQTYNYIHIHESYAESSILRRNSNTPLRSPKVRVDLGGGLPTKKHREFSIVIRIIGVKKSSLFPYQNDRFHELESTS